VISSVSSQIFLRRILEKQSVYDNIDERTDIEDLVKTELLKNALNNLKLHVVVYNE